MKRIARATYYKDRGFRVRFGGPALFQPQMRKLIEGVGEYGDTASDALAHHNPNATIASRGCPVGCWFCIVPKMEGSAFTLIPDFPVRPILCDNNLSALPWHYQQHIVMRYKDEGVELMDANSGFEPATFTEDVYHLWKSINRGPWRFAYDETKERLDVMRVAAMLRKEPQRKKRVYVLIGNEPVADCMARILETIHWGCEPYVQPVIKLNARKRTPWVRFDWTLSKLRAVSRWTNAFMWRKVPWEEYDLAVRNSPRK